jgi:hypothetical protein
VTGGSGRRGGLGSGKRGARVGQQADSRAHVQGREGAGCVGRRRKARERALVLGGGHGGRSGAAGAGARGKTGRP